jgi:uncharacterized protein (DUF305 family)
VTRFSRPTTPQLVALVVALCLLAGIVGWRVGRGFPPSSGSPEVGFLHDMISHHEQAIVMSQIELANGTERGVRVFADEIMRFQSYEIGLMERFLEEWGHSRYDVPEDAMAWMGHAVPRDEMPGLASERELQSMRDADDGTDAWFVALMVDHHAGGVAMIDGVLDHASGDLLQLAQRMRKAQQSEIGELLAAAERAGLDLPDTTD